MTERLIARARRVADGYGLAPDDATQDPVERNLQRLAEIAQAFDAARRRASDDGRRPAFRWCHLEVHERIGSGGFGEVYRAYDAELGRNVALKLRHADRDGATDALMLREARRLARVRHPNVLAVHGANVDGDRAGIWCDLLAGETLEARLARTGAVDVRTFFTLAGPLADALVAIHRAGIIHGDVKAANVMVQADGTPVLMDFGAGHFVDEEPGGLLAGSPLVMAPELLLEGDFRAAADVYALGVLFYRLVTNRHPLEAASLEALRDRHGTGRAPSWRHVPVRLRPLLRRMLARDPADRPSAAEVRSALRSVEERPQQRRRALMLTAVIVVLALGGSAAGLGYLQASHAEREARRAQAKSESVLDFLVRLLAAPRADRDGQDVRVLDVLDAAEAELQRAPPEDPLQRAAIATVLGATYEQLGAPAKARGWLEQAVSTFEQAGCACEDEWHAQLALANNAVGAGRYDEARERLVALAGTLNRTLPASHRLHLELAQARADLEAAAGRQTDAVSAYRTALALSSEVSDPGPLPATLRLSLAQLLLRSDLAEAEALVQAARRWILERDELPPTLLIDADDLLGQVLIERGRPKEAEQVLVGALKLARARAPAESRRVLRLLTSLGVAQSMAGKAEDALATKAAALALAEERFPASADTVTLRSNHAVALLEVGRFDEAVDGFQTVLDQSLDQLGAGHDLTLLARSNLADALLQAGNAARAESVAREARAANRRGLGETHLFTLFAGDVLGTSLTRQGRPGDALAMLREIHGIKIDQFGRTSPYTLDTATRLGEALIAAGRPAEAAPLLLAALEERVSRLGADHRQTRAVCALLARTPSAPAGGHACSRPAGSTAAREAG